MFERRTWHLRYSIAGFSIVAGYENWLKEFFYFIIVRIIHDVLKYIPVPPIPFFHKDDFCYKDNIHWHTIRYYYGHSLGDILCTYFCALSSFEEISVFSIDSESLENFRKSKDNARFIDEILEMKC